MTKESSADGSGMGPCPQCGASVDIRLRFCGECGKALAKPAGSDVAIESTEFREAVAALIAERLKDSKVVDVETAEAIVNRLSNWAKLFAFFVGIPIALFLAWLALLGLQSLSDLKKQVNATQQSAIAEIKKVQGDALSEVGANAARIKADAQRQLAATEATIKSVLKEGEGRIQDFRGESKDLEAKFSEVKTRLSEADRAANEVRGASAKVTERVRLLAERTEEQFRIVNAKVDNVESQLSAEQSYRVRAIVNIFESGQADPDYTKVETLSGDAAGVTYLATGASLGGTLGQVLEAYVAAPDSRYKADIASYVNRANAKDIRLNVDEDFKQLLRKAGSDPVMQRVQEAIFQRKYLAPALRTSHDLGIRTALGIAVVYDSLAHGSFATIRDRTNQEIGGSPTSGIDERRWIKAFLLARLDWLSTSNNALLRKTTYRPTALLKLVEEGNWDLRPPIHIANVDVNR